MIRSLGKVLKGTAAVMTGLLVAASANATTVDLTGAATDGTINGAIYAFANTGPAGTGNIDSFVRVQKKGSEQGYNTSANQKPFDEKGGNFTRDLQAGQVPVVKLLNVVYLQFVLDVNEDQGKNDEFISLDKLQIFTSNAGGKNTTTLSDLGTLRYDLGVGNEVLLNFARAGSGSGKVDMTLLVPLSNFPGLAVGDFIYLYSAFGLKPNDAGHNWDTSDGFEEWAVNSGEGVDLFPPDLGPPIVPEPTVASLFGIGALALGMARRRRA
jgi:hypothetical protein